MIKIRRLPCPTSLNKLDNQFVENDYKNADVIEALLNMQHGKCCYCERDLKMLGMTEREGEHFYPRSSFRDQQGRIQWHLANKWENLLYSCPSCNRAKLGKPPCNDTGEQLIINPSEGIDPENHIDFIIDYPIIDYKTKQNSPLGQSTITELKLESSKRIDLYSSLMRIKLETEVDFNNLIIALLSGQTSDIDLKKREISESMSARSPHAAFRRNFIRKRLNELNNIDIPKLNQERHLTISGVDIHFPIGYEI